MEKYISFLSHFIFLPNVPENVNVKVNVNLDRTEMLIEEKSVYRMRTSNQERENCILLLSDV